MSNWDDLAAALEGMMQDFRVVGSPLTPTKERLEAVEARLGVRFPDEYKDLVLRASAIGVEAKEELWPPPKPLEIGPRWRFLRGMYMLGLGEEIPDWLDIEKATIRFREEHGTDLTPFFYLMGSADRYCFTPTGSIVEWLHDAPASPAPCEKGFYDLVLSFAKELCENMAKVKAEK